MLLLLKDAGRNEKGPLGASFKTFYRLELIYFSIRICNKMNPREKPQRGICKQKSQKSQKIARICEQDSWRKVLRSFTHSSTQ